MDLFSNLPSARSDEPALGGSGRARRARVRSLARDTKAARRRRSRQHFQSLTQAATLRGHLQAAGVLPYATDREPGGESALRSIIWLTQHFAPGEGEIQVTREVVIEALGEALRAYQALVGVPQTPLSPAYRLPVAVAE